MHTEGWVAASRQGLTHPVLGFDHLLAMLSVGILSAQMGGRSYMESAINFCACYARRWHSWNKRRTNDLS